MAIEMSYTEAKGYNLETCNGQYVVVQHGHGGLGYGETYEEAMKCAADCCGCTVEELDDDLCEQHENDGDIECDILELNTEDMEFCENGDVFAAPGNGYCGHVDEDGTWNIRDAECTAYTADQVRTAAAAAIADCDRSELSGYELVCARLIGIDTGADYAAAIERLSMDIENSIRRSISHNEKVSVAIDASTLDFADAFTILGSLADDYDTARENDGSEDVWEFGRWHLDDYPGSVWRKS